ncbi:MAG: acyltransferase [Oculatellaceae cyanobacterium bins.114]|nr:acyltransferase [Oculatellaceae cyanobacterium bins.114]
MTIALQQPLRLFKRPRSLRLNFWVIALLGGIPLGAGIRLRRLLYRHLLSYMGRSVTIQTGVELIHADCIELGHDVSLDRGVRIRCTTLRNRVVLHDKVALGQGVELYCYERASFEIGEGTSLGSYSRMSGLGRIKIGRNCLIAPHVGIFSSNHNFTALDRPIKSQGCNFKGIEIGDDCWLGSGVKVLDGVTIGHGCVVGAGAVVTKSLPPYTIAVGVPAKVVGDRRAMAHSQDVAILCM